MGQNETIPTGDAFRMKHQGSTSDGYGLRNRLMVIFVLFALFPVLCLGILAYSTIHAFLYDNLQNNMETVVTLKTGDVKRYFQQMRQDIQLQAKRPSIQNFMENLNSYLHQSGLTPDMFVKSGTPDRLAKTVKFMSYSQDSGDYSNVFLIDQNGNILYALTEKNDMGANVFGGHFKDTKFSDACRKARRSVNPVFSDYEIRNDTGEERVLGHMICPLRDDDNHVIGFLVFQGDIRYLDHIMAEHLNLGQSFEMYLVGQDGFLRTDSGKRHERKAMKSVIDSEWLSVFDQTDDMAGSKKGEIPLMAYQGPDSIPLLGMHTRLSIGDIRYEMVAEMEKQDAFPLMDRLWYVFLVFMGVGVVAAVGAAFVIADNMIRPIRALTGWALNVATGDLAQMEIKTPDDEIGQFNHSFRQMVGFLKETSRLAIDISSGDYSAEINPRSPYDEMGAALKRMTESLRDASRAMAAVADGDFTVRVTVKGPNDLLARSVNGMVEKIRKTNEDSETQARLKSLQAELNEIMRGDQNLHELSAHILGFLCVNFNGSIGAFYVSEEDGAVVRLYSGFALRGSDGLKDVIHDGDGLIGQVLREKRKIILDYCPDNYVRVHSLVSDLKPSSILIFPFVREEVLEGIIEMGFLGNMMERDMHFLEYVSESICIALSSARSRLKMKELLDKTVMQATDLIIKQDELNAINKDLQESEARLKKQESELRDINRDLVQQTVKLRKSERRLKTKEEELLAANEALRIRSLYLEQQKNAINEKNIELEKTKDALIEKTKTLENITN
jgi:methyl-accepting chemotaxis protein